MRAFSYKGLCAAVIAVALLLAACGGSGGTDAQVNSVTITDASASVEVGQTLELNATVNVSGGASKAVTWSSSDSDLAEVDADGVVTGKAEGNVIITATSTADSSKSDSVDVAVIAAGSSPVTGVSVTPENPSISAGDTVQLSAVVEGSAGVSQEVTWESSNGDVATVDASGLVTGVSNGTATITASSTVDASKSGSAEVTVVSCGPTQELTNITAATTLVGIAGCADYTAGNVTVSAALTIQPGVQIVFSQGARLTISSSGGSISAVGTEANPIIFTGEQPAPGFWDGIAIESLNPSNELTYAEVTYAGDGGYAGVYVGSSGTVKLTNSTFSDSATVGVEVVNGGTLPDFANNTLTANAEGAMLIAPNLIGSLDSASNYSGNAANYVDATNGSTVTDAQTWVNTDNVPFRLNNTTVNAAVTVEPGADFIFMSGARLTVSTGSLNAVGTAEQKITFKGEGDSPGPGSWDGINIESNNPNNEFTFTEIAHGGSGGYANVYISSSGRAKLTNSTFSNSSTVGVEVVNGGALPDFATNTLTGNTAGAMLIPPELIGSLDSASDYSGNAANYIDASNGSTVSAAQTWVDTGGVPFLLNNTTVNAAVTVEPGADFIFMSGARLTLGTGTLSAVGTETDRITFKGAGDSPGAGTWDGINVTSNSLNNELSYVDVAHGGSGGYANVYISSSGRMKLFNSSFSDSATFGIDVAGGTVEPGTVTALKDPAQGNNTFSGNVEGETDGIPD